MRLTSEEHQKLRSNLQKIEDYIVSEICPHMCDPEQGLCEYRPRYV